MGPKFGLRISRKGSMKVEMPVQPGRAGVGDAAGFISCLLSDMTVPNDECSRARCAARAKWN